MPKLSCPVDWTEKEVCRWLNTKNFPSFVEHFEKENIDGKSLLILSEDDVKAILRNTDFVSSLLCLYVILWSFLLNVLLFQYRRNSVT